MVFSKISFYFLPVNINLLDKINHCRDQFNRKYLELLILISFNNNKKCLTLSLLIILSFLFIAQSLSFKILKTILIKEFPETQI